MAKHFSKKYMLACFILFSTSAVSQSHIDQCTQIEVDAERLHCFDKKYHTPAHIIRKQPQRPGFENKISKIPVQVAQFYNFEAARLTDSYGFLTSHAGSEQKPMVVLSTPAQGSYLHSPLLVMACIDNITRLQIALYQPVSKKSLKVKLAGGNHTEITQQWKVLEGGYLLDAGRGLHSIHTINSLLQHEALQVTLHGSKIGTLHFDIQGLGEAIKPLRAACHW